MRRAGLRGCAAVVALAVAGCGGSASHAHPQAHTGKAGKTSAGTTTSKTPAPGPVSAAVVAKAAKLSAAQPGYAVTLKFSVDSSQLGGSASADGSGVFNSTGGAAKLTLDLPGLFAILNPLQTTAILSASTIYIEVPRSIHDEIKSVSPWVSVATSSAGKLLGLSPQALAGALTPRTILNALAADSSGQATYVTSSTVAGAKADQYRVLVPQLGTHGAVNVWVNPDTGLLSRVGFGYSAQGGATTATALVTFTSYGKQSVEAPPAPAQVGTIGSVLKALVG